MRRYSTYVVIYMVQEYCNVNCSHFITISSLEQNTIYVISCNWKDEKRDGMIVEVVLYDMFTSLYLVLFHYVIAILCFYVILSLFL